MTNISLAQSYIIKATKRLKILDVLLQEEAYSDVVRESQEIVELAQKAMLRNIGIDPPKWHDVGITCSTPNFYAAINLAEICKGQINSFVESLLRKLL